MWYFIALDIKLKGSDPKGKNLETVGDSWRPLKSV